MKRLAAFLARFALVFAFLYITSYVVLRSRWTERWEADGNLYMIFPTSPGWVYYFYRPLTRADASITGMRFHLRPPPAMTQTTPEQLVAALRWRYATKSFDPDRAIPADTWKALEETLVLTPSSYGMQPWKFLVIQDKALRESLVAHSYRQRQVADCSHLVVFAVRTEMTEADVDALIHRMVEIRGGTADALARLRQLIVGDIVTGYRSKSVLEWAKLQSYIALGNFMTAASLLGVDTCPMEGFVPDKYDEALGLKDKGYTTSVLCPAGYRTESDRYATLPKVRFAPEVVIEHR